MQCSKCVFILNKGTNELPEMICPFFGLSVPKEFDDKAHRGCNLNYNEALKLDRLYIGEFDYRPKYWFRQMVDEYYKPTEEELAEGKKLEEKRNKEKEIYKAYFEKLKKRRIQ